MTAKLGPHGGARFLPVPVFPKEERSSTMSEGFRKAWATGVSLEDWLSVSVRVVRVSQLTVGGESGINLF